MSLVRGDVHHAGPPVHRDQPQPEPRDQDQAAGRRPPLYRGQAAPRSGAFQGITFILFWPFNIYLPQGRLRVSLDVGNNPASTIFR